MSDLDPTSILRDRYEALAARRIELREELDPLEVEMAKLQAGLRAMGALDVGAVSPLVQPLRLVVEEAERQIVEAPLLSEMLTTRVRHPDVQRAIETQTPSQAIPKGTALFCAEGCSTAHASGGFTDLMALRTHVKRTHDREPTEQEKVPR